MPVIKVSSGGGHGPGSYVEPGTYEVEVIESGDFYLENSQYGDGHMARLTLQIEGTTDVVEAVAGYKLSPRTKLYGWVQALGFGLDAASEFDTDDLIGSKGLAVVVDKEGTNGGTYSRVENIVPLPKGSKTQVSAPNGNPAQPQSVINPDGSANWQIFWAEAKLRGIVRKQVIDRLDGIPLTEVDGPTAQEVLNELTEL